MKKDTNPDGTRTKYISLNKVTVNISGSQDKLFVVRDLSSMVNLQKVMYTKQHLNNFTEKIVRQIQESSEVSSMNLQKLDNHCDAQGRPVADETLNEIRRVLYRIRDFEQVYNICEGTFKKTESNFRIRETIDHVKVLTQADLKKRNVNISNNYSADLPDNIRASEPLFRQIVLNLLHASVQGMVRANVEIKVSTAQSEQDTMNVVIEVINSRNELSKQESGEIAELCLEEELSRILEAENVDVNLKIALILARQLGWPIDFIFEGKECKFQMVVPSTPWGNARGGLAGVPQSHPAQT